jgi:hypothetical protein
LITEFCVLKCKTYRFWMLSDNFRPAVSKLCLLFFMPLSPVRKFTHNFWQDRPV